MHIKSRNVCTMFAELVRGIHGGSIHTEVGPSRYGEVLQIEEPVTLSYTHPRERNLFNAARDVNPYALLYEALWMLAGRNDVAPLAYYTKRFKEFSDDGVTLNDAYGYRWRNADTALVGEDYYQTVSFEPVDQLKVLIDHLRKNPWSRRAVLNMWDVENDLLKIDTSRAVCCNLSVLFQVEKGVCQSCEGTGKIVAWDDPQYNTKDDLCPDCAGKPHDQPRFLNMTVLNRSNDLLWGALGANYVTFSILQEYMAAHLGLGVGVYHQISNNMHAYTEYWKPEQWLAWEREDHSMAYAPGKSWTPFAFVQNPAAFDEELPRFVERHSSGFHRRLLNDWREPFLRDVAHPMLQASHYYKSKDYDDAFMWADRILADDWRLAARKWLERRYNRYTAKGGAKV